MRLVGEDESRLALPLKRGLEEQGYVGDVADDGAEGLWLASEDDYDTVVLDVMLPSLDGLEVTRRLRALVRRGQVERPAVLEVGSCGWTRRAGRPGADNDGWSCRPRSSPYWSCSCLIPVRC
jgi:DNA-binding NarL/FixJ family response regulator